MIACFLLGSQQSPEGFSTIHSSSCNWGQWLDCSGMWRVGNSVEWIGIAWKVKFWCQWCQCLLFFRWGGHVERILFCSSLRQRCNMKEHSWPTELSTPTNTKDYLQSRTSIFSQCRKTRPGHPRHPGTGTTCSKCENVNSDIVSANRKGMNLCFCIA